MRIPYRMRNTAFVVALLAACANGAPTESATSLLENNLRTFGILDVPNALTATYRLCPTTANGGSVVVSLPMSFISQVNFENASVVATADGIWSVTIPKPELGGIVLPSAVSDAMLSPIFLNIHAQEDAAGKELTAWPQLAKASARRIVNRESADIGSLYALVNSLIAHSIRSVGLETHKFRLIFSSDKVATAEPPLDARDVCPNSFLMVNGASVYQESNGVLVDLSPGSHPTVISPSNYPMPGSTILGTAYAIPSPVPEAKAVLKQKIANGTKALPGSYSWAVALAVEDPKHVYHEYCGGVLLGAQTVLTAAHCEVRQGHKAIVGATDLNKVESLGGEALSIVADPSAGDIAPGNGVAALYDADLKIVHLSTSSKKPIAPISFDEVPAGEAFTAIGWGYTETGDSAESLMEAQLTNNTLDACKAIFAPNIAVAPHDWGITKRMICAGGGATATCDGDSGGPLIYGSRVVGLVSFGDVCRSGTESPSLFTKLMCFKSFIQPDGKSTSDVCNN